MFAMIMAHAFRSIVQFLSGFNGILAESQFSSFPKGLFSEDVETDKFISQAADKANLAKDKQRIFKDFKKAHSEYLTK